MAGNVWEWAADCFEEDYYHASPIDDPPGPACSARRVVRGGAWYGSAEGTLRVAYREYRDPPGQALDLGLRCARTP